MLWEAPPPALGDNPWWQQFNERLGGEFKPTLVPYQSFGDRLATTIASGDLPDIMFLEAGLGGQGVVRTISEGAFTDLTDTLAGSGIDPYPNLAQIPTAAWRGCAIEGAIYGVPAPIFLLASEAQCIYRQDWADKLGYPDVPANADELLELYTAFAKGDPDGNGNADTWAIAAIYPWFYRMMFGVPHNWREEGGKLTHALETDEMERSLTYVNKLWNAGVFHPDAPSMAYAPEGVELFQSDRVGALGGAGVHLTFGTGNTNPAGSFRGSHPGVELTHLLPVGADGGAPTIYQTPGFYGMFAIPAAIGNDTQRLEELLRVLNYSGAPFGSEEYLFMNFGIEDRHYTMDADHNPQPIPEMSGELTLNTLNVQLQSQFYFTGEGESVAAQKYCEQAAEFWIADPTQGLVSDTNVRKGAAIRQINDDFELGIITGRRPMSDLAKWRDEWRDAGGDEIRSELEESLQRAQG